MRTLALLLLFAVVGCNESTPPITDSNDERMAIAVEYVRGTDLDVRAKPSDDAPVVTRFTRGESVSVLSKKGAWAEVRTATGSGWARAAGLVGHFDASREDDNLTPRFVKAPQPVTQPSAHGEIVIEASVNTDGDVTSIRTVSNTTGSYELAAKNSAALQGAKFQPIVQHGKRREFIYEYRVHY